MNKIVIVIVIVIVAIVGAVVLFGGSSSPSATNQPPVSGDTKGPTLAGFFDLVFEDYSGNKVSLTDFEGKALVVNSWAAWCPFCRQELPDFVTVQKEFPDEVVIIAIDRAESLETAKKYSDELGVTDDLLFWLDPGDDFYQQIGGFSMPETIFIDTEGNITFHKRGPMDVDEIRTRVRDLLQ